VGPINQPIKRTRARYIITVLEYLTRWVEATPVKDCSVEKTTYFLFEQVITRFGCPRVLMSDQGTDFINNTINAMTEEFDGNLTLFFNFWHKTQCTQVVVVQPMYTHVV
jgi:hypothetical protein